MHFPAVGKGLLGIGAFVLSAFLVDQITVLPLYWAALRAPEPQAECGAIRPGMSRQEVIAFINRREPPREQNLNGNTLVFWRADRVCHVELEEGNKVKSVNQSFGPLP